MASDMLTLPTSIKLSLSLKQLGIVFLAILVTALVVFLIITGKWKTAQRLMLKLKLQKQNLEIQKLDLFTQNNQEKINSEAELRTKLEAERKKIERNRLQTQLEVQGKNHEEIVSALRDIGY